MYKKWSQKTLHCFQAQERGGELITGKNSVFALTDCWLCWACGMKLLGVLKLTYLCRVVVEFYYLLG